MGNRFKSIRDGKMNGKYSWQALCQCGSQGGRNYTSGDVYTARMLGDQSITQKRVRLSGFGPVAYRKALGR
jgi:hypothetical protein